MLLFCQESGILWRDLKEDSDISETGENRVFFFITFWIGKKHIVLS